MTHYSAPSSVRAIDAYRSGDTGKTLLKFARWFSSSEADAKDLLSDAMVSVCDPDKGRPWDPARGSFMTHMRVVMADLAHKARRSARARREVLEPGLAFDDSMSHPGPLPDEALSDARTLEWLSKLGSVLRLLLAPKPLVLQVFDYDCQGVEDDQEVARLIGCEIGEVYEANRQIARHAARVLADDAKAEAARMKELRQRAKNKEPK